MEKLVISQLRLGIVGGGQLGKMLAQAATNWDIRPVILDQSENIPAFNVSSEFIAGNIRDEETVYQFGQKVDLLTIEIEQVNTKALERLEAKGCRILPSPRTLQIIQDKLLQNRFLSENGFPKIDFFDFQTEKQLRQAIEDKTLCYPFVQKKRTNGYDGVGVQIIKRPDDLSSLFEFPSLVEEKVKIAKEVSVIVARNAKGQVAAYPMVEMVFNPNANLLDYLFSPSTCNEKIQKQAKEIAVGIIQKLEMTGILAVEMFIDENDNLWVNELAPRPHNSGHHTIESCVTSQYEQHLRAIFDFPLGSTQMKCPALMMNLLGEPNHSGPVQYVGLTKALEVENLKIHIYGKTETRPYRKMGHVTILNNDLESALSKAKWVRQNLKVISQ